MSIGLSRVVYGRRSTVPRLVVSCRVVSCRVGGWLHRRIGFLPTVDCECLEGHWDSLVATTCTPWTVARGKISPRAYYSYCAISDQKHSFSAGGRSLWPGSAPASACDGQPAGRLNTALHVVDGEARHSGVLHQQPTRGSDAAQSRPAEAPARVFIACSRSPASWIKQSRGGRLPAHGAMPDLELTLGRCIQLQPPAPAAE